jgi:hypothetical protein
LEEVGWHGKWRRGKKARRKKKKLAKVSGGEMRNREAADFS